MSKSKTYEEFVEKFKPKKTTDDCYTPPAIYEAVKDWAVKEYDLEGKEIVRPFYPGGDFENYDYPTDCVVIDNPPFSILTKIVNWYIEKGIKFFLFAPQLTLFSSHSGSYIVTNSAVIYENGANVNTSFITNMDRWKIRSAEELRLAIIKAQQVEEKPSLPKYEYPHHVITSARLAKLVNRGLEFFFKDKDVSFARVLDSQRPLKKSLFGAGFLISEQKALEQKALEQKALEQKAREQEQRIFWELSDREKEIIKNLG
jgi:parB-like nuclease